MPNRRNNLLLGGLPGDPEDQGFSIEQISPTSAGGFADSSGISIVTPEQFAASQSIDRDLEDIEQEEGGFLNTLLDVLALPEIAFGARSIRGGIFAIVNGEGVDGFFERVAKGSPFAHLSDAIFDTEFSENVTGSQVLRAAGVEDPGFFSSIIFEIATDPTTFLGVGALNKIGKAAKAGRAFSTVAGGVDDVADALKVLPEGFIGPGIGRLPLTVGEQAEKGFRSLFRLELPGTRRLTKDKISNIGFSLLPQSINSPVIRGFEFAFESFRRTQLGKGIQKVFSVIPVIGSKPTLQNIQGGKNLADVTRRETHMMVGMQNVLDDASFKFGTIANEVDPAVRSGASFLSEMGFDGVDDLVSVSNVPRRMNERIGEILGLGDEAVREAVGDLGKLTDDASVGVSRNLLNTAAAGVGFDDFGHAIDMVKALPKAAREVYVDAMDVAVKADVADIAKAGMELPGDAIRAGVPIPDEVIKALSISGPEAKALRKWNDFIGNTTDFRFDELAPTLEGFFSLSDEMKTAVLKGGNTGRRALTGRVSTLIGTTRDIVKVLDDSNVDGLLSSVTRNTILQSADDLVHTLVNAPLEGTRDLGRFDTLLEKAAEVSTQEELLNLTLLSADTIYREIGRSEQAVGALNAMIEPYFAHVVTKEGRSAINRGAKAWLGQGSGNAVFSKGREFTDMTVAEINAMMLNDGIRATGDMSFTEMNRWIREGLESTDANFIDKLRKQDRVAAEFFETDIAVALHSRVMASAKAQNAAKMFSELGNPIKQGGFASKVWKPTTTEDVLAMTREMQQFQANGHVIVNTADLMNPTALRTREQFSESLILQNRRGMPDSLGEGATEAEKLIEDIRIDRESFAAGDELKEALLDGSALKVGGSFSAVPENLFREIAGVQKKITSAPYMGRVLRMIQGGTNIWKGWATVTSPSFHFRNLISDLWMAGLAGMTNPKRLYDAARLQKANAQWFSKAAGSRAEDLASMSFKNIRGETIDGQEMMNLMQKMGIIDRDYAALEIVGKSSNDVRRAMAKAGKGTGSEAAMASASRVLGAPMRLGRGAGAVVQNFTRSALFMDVWAKTGDVVEAGRVAKKYLVDYTSNLMTNVERSAFRTVIPFYCVPEDAEILTRDGWKTHDQVSVGDQALVLDTETHRSRWEGVEEVATFDFDGVLPVVGPGFHATEDHRWPVVTGKSFVKGKWYGNEKKIRTTTELVATDRIPKSVPHDDDNESILSPRHAAILGWVVTDGYFRWRGKHCEMLVYQSPKKHADEIEELLGREGRGPHPDTGVIPFPLLLEDTKEITKVFVSKDDFPTIVTRLSQDAREAMFDAMVKAEASVHPDSGVVCFCQQPGPVLDGFQILCSLLGYGLNIGPKRNGCHYCYVSIERKHIKAGNPNHDPRPYTGTVWCPRTPSGTWFMRYRGKIVFTGNTFWRKNLPLVMENIIRVPKGFTIPEKIARNIATSNVPEAEGLPENLTNDYIKDMYGVAVRRGEDGQIEYFMLKSWIPAADIAELADGVRALLKGDFKDRIRAAKNFAGRLSPLLKLPFEIGGNISVFTGKALERYEGQETEMFGVGLTPTQALLLRNVRLLSDLDRLNVAGAPRSGEFGERGEADALTRWSAFMLGVKPLGVSVEQQRKRSEFEINGDIRKLKSERNRLLRNVKTVNREDQLATVDKNIRELLAERVDLQTKASQFRRRQRLLIGNDESSPRK